MKKSRAVAAITKDIDALFDLLSRGKLLQEDFDRRYQALVAERSAAEVKQIPEQSLNAQALEAIGSAIEGITPESLSQWRLAARMLFARVEVGLGLPADLAAPPDNKGRASRHPRRALACWLREPLPTGEAVVVVGMYRPTYTGERYCELLTLEQFEQLKVPPTRGESL